ncbi:hypothetical protein X798_06385, partial [Onchocerca flexuosa]
MEELFCGCSEETWKRTWNESTLQSAIKPDHGYTHDSDQIRWLIQMLASYDNQQITIFVIRIDKLCYGSFCINNIPGNNLEESNRMIFVGGFRSLNPPLTVVKKSGSYANGDDELPSAMTCYNYLKIPAYSSYEVFQKRFDVALRFIYIHCSSGITGSLFHIFRGGLIQLNLNNSGSLCDKWWFNNRNIL